MEANQGQGMNYSVEKYDCEKCRYKHGFRNRPVFGKKYLICNQTNHFKMGCKTNQQKKRMNISNNFSSDNIGETEFPFNTNSIVVSNMFNQNNCIKKWF